MTLEFRDPPTPSPRTLLGRKVKDFFAELADHPDRWAVFRERMPKEQTYVYRSRYGKQYPNIEWCIVCETPDERHLRTVYVRWNSATVL